MDLIISRGFGASIDAMLIDANSGEVTWSGTGEWKRGGIYGFGETKMDEAAMKLLELTFASLEKIERATAGSEASAPITQTSSTLSVTKETATVPAPTRTVPSSQKMTVQQIQQRLSEIGYQPGPADGKMGKNTVEALKKFQQDNNLVKTGQADNETVVKLLQKSEAKAETSNTQTRPSAETRQKSPTTKVTNVADL